MRFVWEYGMLKQKPGGMAMQGVNTTLCYIEKDGCYLMLHRIKKKNDLNHDKWVGIGREI